MNMRQVLKSDVLAAIRDVGSPEAEQFYAALQQDPRESFTTSDAPAVNLRRSLRPKYAVARTRGKLLLGSESLLEALLRLGDRLVTSVALDVGDEHLVVYLDAQTLRFIGCVTVSDA